MQGTRKSEKAPWETYGDQLIETLDPELEAAIAEFASHDPHGTTDSQTHEELCRVKEENDAVAQTYQWLSPDEYADEGARIGAIMHSSELITKLKNVCGLVCWYAPHPQPKRVTLLVDTSNGALKPDIGCWCQAGYAPEYSVCNFDDHGVVLQEAYRGWRTVLMQLMLKGMLTEERATQVFGEAFGPASSRYNAFLYDMRNRGSK
jgi:hypothetical protein